jgi:PKD repeat protein
MDQARATRATFRGPVTLSVEVESLESGSGSVRIDPPNATCANTPGSPQLCAQSYRVGTVVELTATPAADSVFVGWTAGECTGSSSPTCSVTMDQARATRATFRGLQSFTLTLAKVGTNPGTVAGSVAVSGGTTCSMNGTTPVTCTYLRPIGTVLTLTATTDTLPTVFAGWTGCASPNNVCTVTVQPGSAVTAGFRRNQAPVPNGAGPYSGFRNQPIAFDATASSDPDGDPLTFAWTFGDGGSATGPTPTHTYAAAGRYQIILNVSDGRVTVQYFTIADVANRRPVANPGGPYSGIRGTPVAFDGSGSNDPDGDPLSYSWSFGDGAVGTGATPSHAYATVGTFTVTLTVSDGFTTSLAAATTVTIANRAPVANAGGPYSGTRVAPVAFDGSASSDPDGDALSYAWSFGDGATGTGVTPSHAYTTVGTFTVTLVVNDGFTSSPAAAATVTITNVAPIANAGPDRSVQRRTEVTLDGRASSDPDGPIAAWAWRQLSGPAVTLSGGNTAQPRFTAPNVGQPATLEFELTVTDGDGVSATDRVRITVVK